jgi:hypothetical protein
MRTLFLDKPTSRFTTRQWLLIGAVLALIEGAALAAYVYRSTDPDIPVDLGSPMKQCQARGARDFSARGEWPATRDGRDAGAVVSARCVLDTEAFR